MKYPSKSKTLATTALLIMIMVLSGCSVPKEITLDTPVVREKSYVYPFGKVWDVSLKILKEELEATIHAMDKESGLISYTKVLEKEEVYANLLIRPKTGSETEVYIRSILVLPETMPSVNKKPSFGKFEDEFFKKLGSKLGK